MFFDGIVWDEIAVISLSTYGQVKSLVQFCANGFFDAKNTFKEKIKMVKNLDLRLRMLQDEISQADIARKIGCTRSLVNQWLTMDVISDKHRQRLVNAMDEIRQDREAQGYGS